jgi:hypothetical protein
MLQLFRYVVHGFDKLFAFFFAKYLSKTIGCIDLGIRLINGLISFAFCVG